MKKAVNRLIAGGLTLLLSSMMMTACGPNTASATGTKTEVLADSKTQVSESETKTKTKGTVELTVSAAASLKEAMGEIQMLYKAARPETTLVFNFGSSGSLQQQIEQGAPVDVFLSAALKQMKALEEKGLVNVNTKKELLENKVVLIVPKDKTDLASFEDLAADQVKKVGLGKPKSVPAGQYAEEILGKLKILEKVTPKAVYGKDVKAVLAWVETGEVDAGVVYATDAKVSGKVKVVCSAPEGTHKPVIYPVAAVKATKQLDEAKAFINFLSTDEAKKVFEKYGFEAK